MMLQKVATNQNVGRMEESVSESRESLGTSTHQRHAERALTATSLRGIGLIVSLVVNALLARTLSQADFGRFALMTSLLLVLCCVARFGLERTIVRFVATALSKQSRDQYRQSFAKGFAIAAVTTGLVILAWLVVAAFRSEAWLGFPMSSSMIGCMAVMIFCGSFLMIASEAFRITRHHSLANVTMAETSSFLIAMLHLTFLGLICLLGPNTLDRSLTSLTFAMVIPASIGLIFLHRSIRQSEPLTNQTEVTSDKILVGALFKAGGLAMVIQTVTNLTLTCDLWFVERFCSPDDLGQFAAAKRLVNLSAVPMSVISASAAASIATYYAEHRSKELQAMLHKLVWLGACPSLLFLAICLVIPTQILEWYYGVGYGAGSSILCIMTIGYFFLAIVGAAEMGLVMTGHLRTALIISIVAFALLVVGAVLVAPLGVNAIAWISASVLGLRSIAMCVAFGMTSGTWTHLRLPFRFSSQR